MRRPPESKRAFQQLKAKLERGAAEAARGDLLDGDKVFHDLRDLIQQRSRMKKKTVRR
jgi:predicted transcriptional regulator